MGRPKEMDIAMQSSYADGRWNVTVQAWVGTKKAAKHLIDILTIVQEILPDEPMSSLDQTAMGPQDAPTASALGASDLPADHQ